MKNLLSFSLLHRREISKKNKYTANLQWPHEILHKVNTNEEEEKTIQKEQQLNIPVPLIVFGKTLSPC